MRSKSILAFLAALTPLATLVTLAGCQSSPTGSNDSALSIMERVALGANLCWFKSRDPAFSAYRLAPELNSYTGRPRILIVDKNAPHTLPKLVVQAEGNPAKTDAFGPLMQSPQKARIERDINRWISGRIGCAG